MCCLLIIPNKYLYSSEGYFIRVFVDGIAVKDNSESEVTTGVVVEAALYLSFSAAYFVTVMSQIFKADMLVKDIHQEVEDE